MALQHNEEVIDPNSRLLIGSRDKNVAWYNPDLVVLTDAQRDLFEDYCHIAPEEVIPHIVKVVSGCGMGFSASGTYFLACPLFTYRPSIVEHAAPRSVMTIGIDFLEPCIGMFRFIDFSLSKSSSYPDILQRLKSGGKFLDLGCCFGQDMRKLVHDGAPASAVFGAELRKEYVDKGCDLFLDRETFGSRTIVADALDDQGPLDEFENSMDIIHVGLFLHLFDWSGLTGEGQRKACERMVRMLKKQSGVLILGHQFGNLDPKDVPFGASQKVFRHDERTFERLWKEVGKSTHSQWTVKVILDRGMGIAEKKRPWDDENTRRMTFEVRRV